MMFGASAERADGQAAPDDLAKVERSGVIPNRPCAPSSPGGSRSSLRRRSGRCRGRWLAGATVRGSRVRGGKGRRWPGRVRGSRRASSRPWRAKAASRASRSLNGSTSVCLAKSAARRRCRGGRASAHGAGLHEERIPMAVVAAVELEDQVTAREAAGEADSGHAGLGARVCRDGPSGRWARGRR